jgi:hypothetical protein
VAEVLKRHFDLLSSLEDKNKVKNGDDVDRVYGGQIHGAGQLA